MKPLYMWAGGKTKMIPKYKGNPGIPREGYDTFVEPFFGGGAMMIYMHQNAPHIKKFVMNDINMEIVGLYKSIKNHVEQFVKRMDFLESSYLPLNKIDRKKFYYDLRNEYTTNWKQWDPVDESATLYFLMKTGFNGIWQINQKSNGRFATPSGLLNQTTKCYDRENVFEWNFFLQKVEINCGDWVQCCNNVEGSAFYFMDPPYRDSITQYGQVFNDDKHLELIEFCKKKALDNNFVFYCNRDAGDDFYEVNRQYLNISKYPIVYTAGRRATNSDGSKAAKAATEILLHNISLD